MGRTKKNVISYSDRKFISNTLLFFVAYLCCAIVIVTYCFIIGSSSPTKLLGINMSIVTKTAIINGSLLLLFAVIYGLSSLYAKLEPSFIKKKLDKGELLFDDNPLKFKFKYVKRYLLLLVLSIIAYVILSKYSRSINIQHELKYAYRLTRYIFEISSMVLFYSIIKEIFKK
jgi:hypothetical protein